MVAILCCMSFQMAEVRNVYQACLLPLQWVKVQALAGQTASASYVSLPKTNRDFVCSIFGWCFCQEPSQGHSAKAIDDKAECLLLCSSSPSTAQLYA